MYYFVHLESEATFVIQRHTGIEGSGMLRLFEDPSYYLCVRKYNYADSALKAMRNDHTEDFKARCSFFIQKLKPENVNDAVKKSTQNNKAPVVAPQRLPQKAPIPAEVKQGGNNQLSDEVVRKMLDEYERKLTNYQNQPDQDNGQAAQPILPVPQANVGNQANAWQQWAAASNQNPLYSSPNLYQGAAQPMYQQQGAVQPQNYVPPPADTGNSLSFFPVVSRYDPTKQSIRSFFSDTHDSDNHDRQLANQETNHPVQVGTSDVSWKDDITAEAGNKLQPSESSVNKRTREKSNETSTYNTTKASPISPSTKTHFKPYNYYTNKSNNAHEILRATKFSKQRHQEPSLNIDGSPGNVTITSTRSKQPQTQQVVSPILPSSKTHFQINNDYANKENSDVKLTNSNKVRHQESVLNINGDDNDISRSQRPKVITKIGPLKPINLAIFSKIKHREPSLNLDGLTTKVSVPATRSELQNVTANVYNTTNTSTADVNAGTTNANTAKNYVGLSEGINNNSNERKEVKSNPAVSNTGSQYHTRNEFKTNPAVSKTGYNQNQVLREGDMAKQLKPSPTDVLPNETVVSKKTHLTGDTAVLGFTHVGVDNDKLGARAIDKELDHNTGFSVPLDAPSSLSFDHDRINKDAIEKEVSALGFNTGAYNDMLGNVTYESENNEENQLLNLATESTNKNHTKMPEETDVPKPKDFIDESTRNISLDNEAELRKLENSLDDANNASNQLAADLRSNATTLDFDLKNTTNSDNLPDSSLNRETNTKNDENVNKNEGKHSFKSNEYEELANALKESPIAKNFLADKKEGANTNTVGQTAFDIDSNVSSINVSTTSEEESNAKENFTNEDVNHESEVKLNNNSSVKRNSTETKTEDKRN